VTDADPILFLPTTSPVNREGVAIIVAKAQACSAYSAASSPTRCNYAKSYAMLGSTYYYLGTADQLNMVATTGC